MDFTLVYALDVPILRAMNEKTEHMVSKLCILRHVNDGLSGAGARDVDINTRRNMSLGAVRHQGDLVRELDGTGSRDFEEHLGQSEVRGVSKITKQL